MLAIQLRDIFIGEIH